MNENGPWITAFTKREQDEIKFAQLYAAQFAHGTDGHNAKLIIAKMTGLLNANVIANIPPFTTAADSHIPHLKGVNEPQSSP